MIRRRTVHPRRYAAVTLLVIETSGASRLKVLKGEMTRVFVFKGSECP